MPQPTNLRILQAAVDGGVFARFVASIDCPLQFAMSTCIMYMYMYVIAEAALTSLYMKTDLTTCESVVNGPTVSWMLHATYICVTFNTL